MNRRTFLETASVAVAGGMVGLAGCTAPTNEGTETTDGREGTPTAATGGEATTAGAGGEGGATNTVQMVTDGDQHYFDPIGLFVESGETITFRIESGVHSSTAYAEGTGGATTTRIPEGAEPWNSGTLVQQGATFEHTFEVAGTYDYFCIPHKALGMVGRIVVDEPGGPAAGSMPPDGEVPTGERIVEERVVSFEEFSG